MSLGDEYDADEVQRAIDQKRAFSLANLSDSSVRVTTPSAGEEFTVKHGANGAPYHFIVVSIDNGGIVYKSDRAWDRTYAYLKCSAASTKLKLIFF